MTDGEILARLESILQDILDDPSVRLAAATRRTDVDGFKEADFLKGKYNNPSSTGPVSPFVQTDKSVGDITHEWEACHRQFNNGKNDGFVKVHEEDLAIANEKERKCFGTTDDLFGAASCAARAGRRPPSGDRDTSEST